ncbi:copper resistance protein [Corynebacterium poyangense]|uniref:Copper resistance protein n=1 Tax=Corynebacterium poyangense TaxID=2684405 RepID=A0A7H0SQN6_9CORY|nr:cytochrome c oxidase assembly protein [Corynebacterium poyangense]QNQ90861.1 copper resistance protein [Corynebacterium poyangense]
MALTRTQPDTPTEPNSRPTTTWPLYLVFFGFAGIVGAWISFGLLTDSLAALGIPDPGPLTTIGYPLFRAIGWMVAALSVGSFLASSFLISPRLPGAKTETFGTDTQRDTTRLSHSLLTVDGHLACRTGALSQLCFGFIALFMIPLALSDVSGQPLATAIRPANWPIAIDQVAASLAYFWVAVIAMITGICGLFCRKWISQPLLFGGALFSIIPLGLQGHNATGGNHDYGTNSYLWHLIFLMIWVGGLMGLIAHGRRLGPGMGIAVRRYSWLALMSIMVMAASGLINAVIRVTWGDLTTTAYGWIIIGKTIGVIVLAFFGYIHRQITIPKLLSSSRGNTSAFIRVSIVEVAVMAAITGLAITMGRTPPPVQRNFSFSSMAIQIGYDLYVKPTITNIWTIWRFDIMFGTLALGLAAGYLWGLYRLRQQGKKWSGVRTFWWMLGCASLLITMCSGIGLYMPASFSMHMIGHMTLSMVVPVFLVLGSPLQLVLDSVPAGKPGQPGLREWTLVAINNPILRFLMHPGINTVQFIVFFYILYATPFYAVLISEHAGHLGMNWVFIISGYLYFWEMIGTDPKPQHRSTMSKLGWLVFSMPFHLYFGVYLMMLNSVLAEDFYLGLQIPWDVDLMHDQKVGGGVAWASGSFPLTLVFAVLFRNLLREDKEKEAKEDARLDREESLRDQGKAVVVEPRDTEQEPEEETTEQSLAAYNELLARMNAGEGNMQAHYYYQEEMPLQEKCRSSWLERRRERQQREREEFQ